MLFFKRLRRHIIVLLLFSVLFSGAPTDGATLPPADREESERFFALGYEDFIKREYASALENLDRALKLNTYLVDYYLLRGLVLHPADKIAQLGVRLAARRCHNVIAEPGGRRDAKRRDQPAIAQGLAGKEIPGQHETVPGDDPALGKARRDLVTALF